MATNNNIPEEQFEEIERFVQQLMPAEEENLFRQKIQADPTLKNQVEEVRLMLLGIEEASLQNKLKDFHRAVPQGVVRKINYGRWLAAASVIVLISVAAWWLVAPHSSDNKLFTEFFKPDPGMVSSMGATEDYNFDRAMIDYKTGNYTAAIKVWKELLQANPSGDTLNYFIGSAYLNIKQTDSAAAYLKKVAVNNKSAFNDDANWYMGLALILENKRAEAIPYINNSSHREKETLLFKLK